MKTAMEFRKSTETYKVPFWSGASPEQRANADRTWLSAIESVSALKVEREAIVSSLDDTPKRKVELMRAWTTKVTALRRDLIPVLERAKAEPADQIANLVAAAEHQMEWDPAVKGFLRKKADADPQTIAGGTEARNYYRTLPPQKVIDLHREMVLANDRRDDERIHWMEDDPTGLLIPERIREWARQVRVERSPYMEQIQALQAAQRSFGLLFETIRMELDEMAREAVNA